MIEPGSVLETDDASYTVLGPAGEGGFGIVLRVVRDGDGAVFAAKVMQEPDVRGFARGRRAMRTRGMTCIRFMRTSTRSDRSSATSSRLTSRSCGARSSTSAQVVTTGIVTTPCIHRDIDVATDFRFQGPPTFSGVEKQTIAAIGESQLPKAYKKVLIEFFKGENLSVSPRVLAAARK